MIADITGLIEGVSIGKGLGINFLKHIEKVSLLLHCISAESSDLTRDYKVIMKELGDFSLELVKKKQIVLLTKSELLSSEELEKKLKELKKLERQVIPVSILDEDSLLKLKSSI